MKAKKIGNTAVSNIQDWLGYTTLHTAVRRGDTEIVKALIEDGANVNSKNKAGDTILMTAAEYGNIEIVQMLINAGAKQ